ncbi:CPBP family intramembrane metalloprotease [Olleya sp. YS]|uniref:CPBP family intramembrane glutamic endopeptidase n=1 Tax=Olleya sp. YS TaxID=3028318 RepID=UPI0024345646|nr:CPBP family intramembrane metalloprotease [Olleya sp. YS]WGD34626.1 CPBP family intramembrane metalloprotease [Olleya sp. YS]
MKALFYSILDYVKNPRLKQLKHTTVQQKLSIVFACIPICIGLGLSFGLLISIMEVLGVYNSDSHAINKLMEEESPVYILLTAVILAPIIEEFIFRGPLTLFSKKYFKLGFYVLAIVFGYVHLFNFEITTKILVLSPLFVAPQIIIGLVFGYVRVRLGLVYSILLHGCYNGVLMIPAVLFMEQALK